MMRLHRCCASGNSANPTTLLEFLPYQPSTVVPRTPVAITGNAE